VGTEQGKKANYDLLLDMHACQVVAVHPDLLERGAAPERLEPARKLTKGMWGLGLGLG